MSNPAIAPSEITNWWAIKRAAIARLGQQEFLRRVGVAHAKAREIAEDPEWFPGDIDRQEVFCFMAWRLQSLAVQLTDTALFEAQDHDTLACVVIEGILEAN